MRVALALLLFAALAPVRADDVVSVCFNYGCRGQTEVRYSDGQLDQARHELDGAASAVEERARLAQVVGRLYRWAGDQSPIGADRAGNDDDGVYGRMDCIDHSTNTTRLLKMLEARGGLKHHRVLEPARRTRWWVTQHFSAVVEQSDGAEAGARFVIDSWFVAPGEPAVVLPLEKWLDGEGPNV
jgi:hypothetical protein